MSEKRMHPENAEVSFQHPGVHFALQRRAMACGVRKNYRMVYFTPLKHLSICDWSSPVLCLVASATTTRTRMDMGNAMRMLST
jgi:hypothetical protein